MDEKQKPECPECKKNTTVIQIIYGQPNEELQQQAENGEVILAGCCMAPENWHCKDCNFDFE